MIVAKVGGSLFDWPGLGPALLGWLREQTEPVLLFPGGGEAADAVRSWDRVHSLGEESAHGLAIHSLSLGANFLKLLLPGVSIVKTPVPGILDPTSYFGDESGLPHRWSVTTDSLAAWVARECGATKLALLKSTDAPAGDWGEAGFVDAYFNTIAANAPFAIEAVNLRRRVNS